MRIIHCILGKANPERMNGVNRVVFELATQQARAGIDAEVWGITKVPEHNYPAREFRTRLFRESSLRTLVPDTLKEAIGTLDPVTNMFHLHGGFIPVYPALSNLLRRQGVPYLITAHGAYNKIALQKNRLVKKMYLPLIEKKILQGARYVHCLGKSETEVIGGFIPAEKIRIIPYGFESRLLHVVANREQREEMHFGFCGRIDIHTKGLDILLEGFLRFLWQTESGAVMHIIGGGEELPRLRALAEELNISGHVIFHGPVYGDDKLRLLSDMDVFFHTSRNEGLPTAVLEACLLGIPCVLSEATNLGDYIRASGCGIMLRKNNAENVCKAMMQYHREKEEHRLERIGPESLRILESNFNWNNIIPQFQNLYQPV